MKLRYETSIATLIQLIVAMAFFVLSGIISIVSDCVENGAPECVGNGLVSLILILLQAIWFSFLAALGYAAQDKRSHKLALLLIAAEFITLMVSLFDARQADNPFYLLINLVNSALAIWVIYLSWRLYKAKGGRITTASSPRKRRRGSSKKPV